MARHGRSPAAVAAAILALASLLCRAEVKASLRYIKLDSSRTAQSEDFNALIEEANKERDAEKLKCISKTEAAKVSQLAEQARLDFAERSLQAVATAEVQLKAHQGTLHAKASSIESQRDELQRLCGRLDEGRKLQQANLKSSGDVAAQVHEVAERMQGSFSAETEEIQGSISDEKAYLSEGHEACESEFDAVSGELNATRGAISDIQEQLEALEEKRNSTNGLRTMSTDKLAELEKDKAALKDDCAKKAADVETKKRDLQSRRAEVEGLSATDCEVSDWRHGDCSKECEGGTKTLTREVLRRASGGAACPALTAVVECNTQECEAKCQLGAWSEWTQCSKKCNGGHRTRSRTVVAQPAAESFLETPSVVSGKVAMFDNDKAAACGLTQDVESCNTNACGDDCTYGQWGLWGPCTKACGGGKRGRRRAKQAATPAGAEICDGFQEEFSTCQEQQCPGHYDDKCLARQDMVVMMDASELLSEEHFKTQQEFVTDLLEHFELDRHQHSLVGVVIFGTLMHGVLTPTSSRDALHSRVHGSKQGRGGQNLDLGLDDARKAITSWSSRPDAPKTVFAVLQGKPDAVAEAAEKAKVLKDLGVRIVLAVVGSCVVNKHELEKIVSEPVEENVFYFQTYQELYDKRGFMRNNLCPNLGEGAILPNQYLPLPPPA